jgi:hypothetical protein
MNKKKLNYVPEGLIGELNNPEILYVNVKTLLAPALWN